MFWLTPSFLSHTDFEGHFWILLVVRKRRVPIILEERKIQHICWRSISSEEIEETKKVFGTNTEVVCLRKRKRAA
jgi:hypothetical protein